MKCGAYVLKNYKIITLCSGAACLSFGSVSKKTKQDQVFRKPFIVARWGDHFVFFSFCFIDICGNNWRLWIIIIIFFEPCCLVSVHFLCLATLNFVSFYYLAYHYYYYYYFVSTIGRRSRYSNSWGQVDDMIAKNDMTKSLAWYSKMMWFTFVTWDDIFPNCKKINLIKLSKCWVFI